MKSLRELRSNLTGIRLGAVNSSIWSIAATLNERARAALNDAISQYEFNIQGVYTSVPTGVRQWALPNNVTRILSINEVNSDTSREIPYPNYTHTPTDFTNLIQLHKTIPTNNFLEIRYESRLSEFPEDVFLVSAVSQTVRGVVITGGVPANVWPSPGYFELTTDNSLLCGKEIVKYDLATPTGFSGLYRAVEGTAFAWPGGARISCVAPVPSQGVVVLERAAQAVMYEYWLGHRAQYDQYTAIVGINQLTVEDIVTIVRVTEARAEQSYRKIKKVPRPGRARRP